MRERPDKIGQIVRYWSFRRQAAIMARLKVWVRIVNTLAQLASVFVIAGGAGLFAYSRHIDPPIAAVPPATQMSPVGQNTREKAAAAEAWGTGFMTLGTLGLVVPWINSYARYQALPPRAA